MIELVITNKKGESFTVLYDECDKDIVENNKWCLAKRNCTIYLKRRKGDKFVLLHREILGLTSGVLCDHEDGNGLNNQRNNLRASTYSQNNANRKSSKISQSKYLGVSFDKRWRKWVVHIRKDKLTTLVGAFDMEQDAALAYNEAAIIKHGAFAKLNKV
jgi:hypothetical protein